MDWAAQRQRMVDEQLEGRGIRGRRVLEAFRLVPRELFLRPPQQFFAYQDNPLGIGFGQTISQPYMAALMAQQLDLAGFETVLEVGTGSGYFAAILSHLVARVFTIEIIPELAERARQTLQQGGYHNVHVITGDGCLGYDEEAPFDGISVAAASCEVPPALFDQLAEGGRLVIPLGPRDEQDLVVFHKKNGQVLRRVETACRFVPLVHPADRH